MSESLTASENPEGKALQESRQESNIQVVAAETRVLLLAIVATASFFIGHTVGQISPDIAKKTSNALCGTVNIPKLCPNKVKMLEPLFRKK